MILLDYVNIVNVAIELLKFLLEVFELRIECVEFLKIFFASFSPQP